MNRFQEALGHIACYCSNHHTLSNDFDTLKELIDNYDKSLRLCVMETKEKVILEKALDKACKWITDNDGWINIFGDDDWRSRFPNGVKTKEEWKEYLLKESEEQ